jgi:hypothetical protein
MKAITFRFLIHTSDQPSPKERLKAPPIPGSFVWSYLNLMEFVGPHSF